MTRARPRPVPLSETEPASAVVGGGGGGGGERDSRVNRGRVLAASHAAGPMAKRSNQKPACATGPADRRPSSCRGVRARDASRADGGTSAPCGYVRAGG